MFLQYGTETKRALLPNEITSLYTVKALFVRSFPRQLNMEYLDSPACKIYILDSNRDMFYDMEDLRCGEGWNTQLNASSLKLTCDLTLLHQNLPVLVIYLSGLLQRALFYECRVSFANYLLVFRLDITGALLIRYTLLIRLALYASVIFGTVLHWRKREKRLTRRRFVSQGHPRSVGAEDIRDEWRSSPATPGSRERHVIRGQQLL